MEETNNILTEAIVIDINAIPDGMNVEKWLDIARATGVCLVDSTRGHMPFMMHPRRKLKFELRDIKDE